MREGRFALWNPLVFEGSFQLPAVYPPDLLHALWPSPVFVSWLLTLHLPLAALAAYWLARELGASRPGAFQSGAVYALGGFALSCLNLYVFLQALALAPFVAGLLRRAALRGGRQVPARGPRPRAGRLHDRRRVRGAGGRARGCAGSRGLPAPADPRAPGGRGPARGGARGAAGGPRGRPVAGDRARGGPGARRRPGQRRAPRGAAPGPPAQPVRRAPGPRRGLVGRAVLQQGAAVLPVPLLRPPDPGPGRPRRLRAAAPSPPRRARPGGSRPLVRARGAGRPRVARREASPGVVVPFPGQGAAAAALRGGPGLRLRCRPAARREPPLGAVRGVGGRRGRGGAGGRRRAEGRARRPRGVDGCPRVLLAAAGRGRAARRGPRAAARGGGGGRGLGRAPGRGSGRVRPRPWWWPSPWPTSPARAPGSTGRCTRRSSTCFRRWRPCLSATARAAASSPTRSTTARRSGRSWLAAARS